MATTTPNFGWPVPTSTDLVKDGATAIEALGDGIDTSLVDLKGGTTGQVLSKATSADMDFTWVTSDDANAIQNAIVDAKGDLIAASAADTPARLAVGNNGETLVADSSTSTGLRYTAGTVQSNPVLNSSMQIWQRGTSFNTSAVVYTADRWQQNTSASSSYTLSRQVTNDTTNLPFIQYCLRFARNSGASGSNSFINQTVEMINSIPFSGKTVTYSFYARAGAGNTQTMTANVYSQTSATEFNVNTGGSWTTPLSQSISLSTTWTRYTITGSIGATSTQIAIGWQLATVASSAIATDFVEITGVQLDIGSVALPFRTYAGTIQGELAAARRYYQKFGGNNTYEFIGQGFAGTTTSLSVPIQLDTPMRVTPTSVDFSTLCWWTGGAVTAISAATLQSNSNSTFKPVIAMTTTGVTANSTYGILTNNSTSGYLALNAEL